MKRKKLIACTCLLVLSCALESTSQNMPPVNDADQIRQLLVSLSNRSRSPADALDPLMSAEERAKNLKQFSSTSPYELNLAPDDAAPSISGDAASFNLRVHYKAEDGNSFESGAKAHFVKRNGAWYFANYAFMSWPLVLILTLIACLALGLGYGITVLVLVARLSRQNALRPNVLKIPIPLFWPSLFRRSSAVRR